MGGNDRRRADIGTLFAGLATGLITVLVSGCTGLGDTGGAKGAGSVVLGQDSRYIVVVPGRGETLRSLAARFLGDPAKDWVIADANGFDASPPVRAADRALVIPLQPVDPVGVAWGVYQTVPILSYHRFGDRNTRMTLTASRFETQMAYLRDHGYRVIPLGVLAAFLRGERALPRKAVVLTIDDGHRSAYTVAYPILQRYGFPATIFVYTDYLDYGGLTRSQIEEMTRSGLISIQAHSKTHANLALDLAAESPSAYVQRIEMEVRKPAERLTKLVAGPVTSFAYPYGDTNEQVIALLRDNGYTLGLTVYPGGNPFFAPPYMLRRNMVFGDRGLDAFRKALRTSEEFEPAPLARISHRSSTTNTDLRATAGRTRCERLNIVSTMPSPFSLRAARCDTNLGALATTSGEKCGLGSGEGR